MTTNRLSRRGFFGCIFGGIAAGTLLNSPAIVDACEQFSEDPIAEAIRLARIPLDTTMASNQRMAAFDNTVNYLNWSFDSSLAQVDEVHTLFSYPSEFAFYGDSLTEADMHRILLGTVPLAIVRLMLYQHNVPFNPWLCSGLREFVGRYRDVIKGRLQYSSPDRYQSERERLQRHQERMAAWRSGQQRLISGTPAHLVGI